MKKLFFLFILVVSIQADEIKILSKYLTNNQWHIEFMLAVPHEINSTKLSIGESDIIHESLIAPNPELSESALFLIDSSISMNTYYVKGIKQSIKDIFADKNPWEHWAIASFDSDMKVVGDFNQTSPNKALHDIKIKGNSTELYRAVLEGLKLLEKRSEKRKFLLVFSDGKYEDESYSYEDVIKKARDLNVTILSFGYKDSVYLQSIRRIAEETGGKLWKAHNYTHKLDHSYKKELFGYFHNFGMVIFDKNLLKPNNKGVENMTFLAKDDENKTFTTTLQIPVKKLVSPKPSSNAKKPDSKMKYYIASVAGLLLLGLLYMIFRKKEEDTNQKDEISEEHLDKKNFTTQLTPLAYFETPSGDKLHIYKNYNLIGSEDDNDVIVKGDYISRHHAIVEYKGRSFFIIDTNSTNGVTVNDIRIQQQEILNGDKIALGPLVLEFRINQEEIPR